MSRHEIYDPGSVMDAFFARAEGLILRPLLPLERQRLTHYHDELLRWNKAYNLIGRQTSSEELLERHFLDCLAAYPHVQHARTIVDLGSGAGLPGLLLALLSSPEQRFTLVEPQRKKWTFLDEMIRSFGLEHARALMTRDGELHEAFDLVISRAYAATAHLVRVSAPLLHPGGQLLLFKGLHFQDELNALPPSSDWSPPRVIPNPASGQGGVLILMDYVPRET